MNSGKVYIIIINFGTPGHTTECLESILLNTYTNYQVVIVDVLNKKGSVHLLNSWIEKKKDERFVLIEENENKGYAFANNIGIKYAINQTDCTYLWILNNDTVIEQNCLTHLISCNNTHKNPGFVGSKILDYDDREIIQNIGGTFNEKTGYSVLTGMGEKDRGQYNAKEIKIDYVIGASMFCNVDLISTIGLMPDDYFLYYEDIDWCITAQKAGFTNFSCAESVVYHKQGVSTGVKLLSTDTNIQKKKHLYLSYLKFYRRHFPKLMPVAYFILFKQWAGRIYHGQFAEAKLIAQVIFSK